MHISSHSIRNNTNSILDLDFKKSTIFLVALLAVLYLCSRYLRQKYTELAPFLSEILGGFCRSYA